MTTQKPDILLAHGAWHPPRLYNSLQESLRIRSYNLIVPALPSMGVEATGVSWKADTEVLVKEAELLFAKGKEVVLVAHSYGGIPACVATRANSVEERAKRGLTGGFIHIIFVCAFAIPAAGLSNLMTVPGAQWLDWHVVIDTDKVKQLFVNEKSKEHMYNDLPAETAQDFYDALVPQSYAATVTPVDFAVPDIIIPKTYVVCEKDNAFPVALQHELSSALGFEKVMVSGGHSAFASIPDELADALVKIAEGGNQGIDKPKNLMS